jgi:hypothetical protein
MSAHNASVDAGYRTIIRHVDMAAVLALAGHVDELIRRWRSAAAHH